MFYVYDLDGLRFRGPMEALERERRVERRIAVQPLVDTSGRPATAAAGKAALAAETYRQGMQRQNLVEPLVYIYEIMTSPVTSIHREMSLLEAWQKLKELEVRQLPVLSDRQQVLGVLSDRDILKRLNVVNDEVDVAAGVVVGDVIEPEAITTDPMSDIRRVARVMAFYHIDAMPVVEEGGRMVGIVTRGDILRGFAENPRLNLWA